MNPYVRGRWTTSLAGILVVVPLLGEIRLAPALPEPTSPLREWVLVALVLAVVLACGVVFASRR